MIARRVRQSRFQAPLRFFIRNSISFDMAWPDGFCVSRRPDRYPIVRFKGEVLGFSGQSNSLFFKEQKGLSHGALHGKGSAKGAAQFL